MDIHRDVFLLLGQSNMAGRGKTDDCSPIPPNSFWWKEFHGWEPLSEEPFYHDRADTKAGKCLTPTFLQNYSSTSDRSMGVVPLAVGGSPLSEWTPGSALFTRALECAKEIKKDSKNHIIAALWHQGESDAVNRELAQSYATRLTATIEAFRRGLGIDSLPFVVGEIGHFLEENDSFPEYKTVNQELHRVAAQVPRVGLVTAEGLEHHGDVLHFDTPALRLLGCRYAAELNRIIE